MIDGLETHLIALSPTIISNIQLPYSSRSLLGFQALTWTGNKESYSMPSSDQRVVTAPNWPEGEPTGLGTFVNSSLKRMEQI
jgi:hypothetical protein